MKLKTTFLHLIRSQEQKSLLKNHLFSKLLSSIHKSMCNFYSSAPFVSITFWYQ